MNEDHLALCGRFNKCQSFSLHAIIEMSKSVGREIKLETILNIIVEKTTELMDCERCTVFVYDEAYDELWSYAAVGVDSDEIRFPLGVGIAGDCALNRKIINIADVYSDSRFNRLFDVKSGFRTRSILCCPMINVEGELIGVVEAINKNMERPFDSEDEVVIEYLAGLSAIAVERAFLTNRYVELRKNQQMMDFAREIQMSMLPVDFSADSTDADVYAFISAAADVGGDFYDYFFVRENVLCFTIADVSGKGVPAALFMAMAKTLFSVIARDGSTPGQILRRMNLELSRKNDAMMFVTMFAGALDTVTGELTYSNGGHNSPYIVSEDGSIEKLDSVSGAAVGLMQDAIYEEARTVLTGRSTIFLYTDGVDEAKDKRGRMFTVARLEQALSERPFKTLRDLVTGVLMDVANFSAGAPQSDDVTILTVRLKNALHDNT